MKGYENIKAFRAVALTLKGYSEEETSHGLAWSCKVYCDNKKIGTVSNTGNGAVTACDVAIDKQVALVSSLKSKGYQLTPSLAGQVCTEPADPDEWFVAAISQMVDEVTRLRQLKRLVKTHLIIRQYSSEHEFSFYKAVPSAASKARLTRQLGSDLICFMNDEIHGL